MTSSGTQLNSSLPLNNNSLHNNSLQNNSSNLMTSFLTLRIFTSEQKYKKAPIELEFTSEEFKTEALLILDTFVNSQRSKLRINQSISDVHHHNNNQMTNNFTTNLDAFLRTLLSSATVRRFVFFI